MPEIDESNYFLKSFLREVTAEKILLLKYYSLTQGVSQDIRVDNRSFLSDSCMRIIWEASGQYTSVLEIFEDNRIQGTIYKPVWDSVQRILTAVAGTELAPGYLDKFSGFLNCKAAQELVRATKEVIAVANSHNFTVEKEPSIHFVARYDHLRQQSIAKTAFKLSVNGLNAMRRQYFELHQQARNTQTGTVVKAFLQEEGVDLLLSAPFTKEGTHCFTSEAIEADAFFNSWAEFALNP